MSAITLNFRAMRSGQFPRAGLACLVCVAALVSGCGARRRPSIAWTTAVMLRPTMPSANASPTVDMLEAAPDLRVELSAPPRLATPRANPPRPHVASLPAGAGGNTPGDVLVLAPQLSAEETASAQRETNQDISVAEKNLASVQNRKMSPAQTDLASKVRGFVADAKDAARTGDWDRARSLARKAQILSQDLIGSL